MGWVIALWIVYDAGYTEKINTDQQFDTQMECMLTARNPEYRNAISQFYKDKGIRNVYIYCKQNYQDKRNHQDDMSYQEAV